MRNKSLLIALILFLIISSVSFVSASDISANDVNNKIDENTVLSAVSDGSSFAEDIEFDSNGELSSTLGQMDDIKSTDETENGGDEAPVLGANNNEEILGANRYPAGNSVQDIMDAILSAQSGDTIYLNGSTYTGSASTQNDGQVYLRNIKIVGGTPENPNMYATIIPNPDAPNDNWRTALSFGGKLEDVRCIIDGKPVTKGGFYSNTGYMLEGVSFEHINCTGKFLSFSSGSLTDCTINDCYSAYQFICLSGSYCDNVPIPVKNCNFINCHQTYVGDHGVDDGTGQLGAVFGVNMTNCKFINTSSAQHGGALCIADESEWGSARVASTLTNCEFINVTSRWFAVYIHGNFRTSYAEISSPQIIDNCKFINCTGTGEYSAGVGISHDNLIVRNSEFDNCTGGQGAAIMVGGLDSAHDGFSGRNTKGNNVSIINCTFKGNVAQREGQTSSFCDESFKSIIDSSYDGSQRYDFTNPYEWLQGWQEPQYTPNDNGAFFRISNWWGGYDYLLLVDPGYREEYPRFDYDSTTGEYTPNDNGAYYQKHPAMTFYPNGNAGAVCVYGNDTKIFNCTFDRNGAESGDGAAIYIVGSRTNITNTKFYNHDSINGTVYILGENTTISKNTYFKNNTAEDSGACVYIKGNNTQINNTKFDENRARNGAGIFIQGRNTTVISSEFNKNNATNGGAVYIEGNLTNLNNNKFNGNNVTNQGGAVFVRGDNSAFTSNNFTYNEAVPASSEGNTGLGGAIYVKGDNTNTTSNTFDNNKARNGSAIYTDGNNFRLQNDAFGENQAWSYLLIIIPDPMESYYNTTDVNVTVCHVGGDNIINAIHNTASNDEIHFKNVTYKTFINDKWDSITTDSTKFVEPVAGAEKSNNGEKLYQDSREYKQKIYLCVEHECGEIIYETPLNNYLITDIYGEVNVTLKRPKTRAITQLDQPLSVGDYSVYAEHPEDWNYKYIKSTNTFRVLPYVDLSVNKTSDKAVYNYNDTVIWTITVHNADNATNATNVKLTDLFPFDKLEFVSIKSISRGTSYNNETGIWTIGNMTNGTTFTLVINSRAIATGEITNSVNVTCTETDWDESNNYDDETVEVFPICDVSVVKDVNVSEVNVNDTVEWTISVHNGGPSVAENVVVNDTLPDGCIVLGGYSQDVVDGHLIIDVGDLAPYASVVIKYVTQLIAAGPNTNFVVVNTSTNESDRDNNDDDETAFVSPICDVSVVKTSDKDEYFVDDVATWTIKVHNAGNASSATNVNLTELFPYSEFEIMGVDTDGVGDYDRVNDVWHIGFLGSDDSVTLVITARAKVAKVGIDNNVSVVSSEKDWNLNNNNDTSTVDVIELPVPKKTVSNNTPYYHDEIEYNLTITNTGTTVYTNNLTVVDSLPDGLEFVRVVGVTGAKVVSYDEDSLTWVLTDISSDTPAVITLRVIVTEIGNLTNNLTLTGPNGTDKTVNCTVEANPLIDLSTSISSGRNEYFLGDIASWIIKVHNAGNGTNATNVTLYDLFPADNFVFMSAFTLNGTFDNESMSWDIGFMGNGTDATLVIFAYANVTGVDIRNYVDVGTPNEAEWDYGNNDAECFVDVVDLPVPVKTVSNDEPFYHDEILYNLTIVNDGSFSYYSILTVVDSLPEGLMFIRTENITGANEVFPEYVDAQEVTWYLTDISPDVPAVITVRVMVNEVGNLTNNLTLYSLYGHNRTVNCTVEANPLIDLSTTITSNKDVYFIGDFVVWTITVHNAGNGTNATGVDLDEWFPYQYFEYIGYATDNGTYDNESEVWDIGPMGNGTDATLYIYAYAKVEGNQINNRVVVAGNEKEWNPWNNFAYNYVDVLPKPIVEKTVDEPTPYYGDEVLYYLRITNVGTSTYDSSLIVIDSLPEGLEFIRTVDIDGADVVCAEVVYDKTVNWVITNISADKPALITVLVKVNDLGNLTNNLTIITPDATESTVNCTINPVPIADLEVIKYNGLGLIRFDGINSVIIDEQHVFVYKGDTVDWFVTVINHGPNDAINAVATDLLPVGLVYSSDDSNGKYNPDTGVWNIGNLSSGESVTLKIVTLLNTSNVTITNNVDVKSDTYDSNESNNHDNSSIYIEPEADLEIVKLVSTTIQHKNDIVIWTIKVTNKGADNAINTVVTDKLPEGLIYVSDDSLNKYDYETGIWNVGDLACGESRILNIKTKVLTTNATIVNIANVSSDTYDPNEENNICNNSTTVPPEADLVITIEPDITEVKVGDKVIYTIKVKNQGPDTAINSIATIKLPNELELLGYNPSNGTYDSVTGTWTIGDVNPGDEVTLILETKALVSGTIIVEASVVCDTYESDLSNNNDTAEIKVLTDEIEPPVEVNEPPKMHAAGNPIAMAILALLACVGVTLRRRN